MANYYNSKATVDKSTLKNCQLLLENLPYGFAYHQVILDSTGASVDSVLLEVNAAFETLTGLGREYILGKRVTEVFPGIEKSDFDWMDICDRVALQGETIRVEHFCRALSRFYEITAYSDQPGYFATIIRDVTEEKVSHEFLKQERTQLFSILDNIEEIVYVSDPYTYEVLYANQWTQKMFGKSLVRGLCYQELQKFSSPCPFCTNSIILQNKGEPYSWEYYNPVLRQHFLVTDRIIRWPDDRDVRLEIAIDITTQKEAQINLQKSEKKWRTTLHSLGEGMISTDTEGRVVYMNPVAEALTGWVLEESRGKMLEEVFYVVNARTRERIPDPVGQVLESGMLGKLTGDILLISKDETEHWIAASASPLCDSQGNLQGVVMTFQDITREHQLKQELERREKRYQTILYSVQDIIFALDKTQRYTGIYGQGLKRYHLTPEDFLDKYVWDVFGKENYQVYQEASKKALRGESVVYEGWFKLNGERRYFQTSLSPVKSEEGSIEEIIGTVHDITDLKQAEEWQQKLLDSIPYPASLINRERRILAQNKATESVAGSKVGDTCWFSFHGIDTLSESQKLEFKKSGIIPPGARCLYCKADEALRRQETIVEEIELKGIILETGWVPLDSDIYLHYSIDITKYKEVEQELRKERDLAQKYLDTADIIFLILNPQAEVTLLNRKGVEVLGYTKEELMGKNWIDTCIPARIQEKMKSIFSRLIRGEGKEEKYVENPIITRSGEERLIAWHNALLQDEKGNIIAVLSAGIDITENRKIEEELRHLNFHDRLTSLYNRNFLETEIKRLDATAQLPVSVLMVDVNGLKLVNDTYGHRSGDELLRAAAEVLRASCRKQDIVARFGGDEFVILLPETSWKEAQVVYQRIREKAEKVLVGEVPLSLALGFATKEKKEESLIDALRKAEDEMYKQKLAETKSSRSAIINALLKTLETKSYETRLHTQRMQKVGLAIAETLQLPDTEINRLKLAIMLHDIGKISLPEEILKKSGLLLPEEWELMKKHPEFGYRIVRATPEFAHVAEEVWSHHEWWDGSGYPRRLKKEEIPLLARIIALADAYEVMRYGRPYNKARSLEEIIAELRRNAGTQFDPKLVEIFTLLIQTVCDF
ncbi:MAG: hypothetical protein PWP57_522 [Candidatus Atribacteria bacterium]|nr:hypothetical protein [Candidatus Atribacteria bacterium]